MIVSQMIRAGVLRLARQRGTSRRAPSDTPDRARQLRPHRHAIDARWDRPPGSDRRPASCPRSHSFPDSREHSDGPWPPAVLSSVVIAWVLRAVRHLNAAVGCGLSAPLRDGFAVRPHREADTCICTPLAAVFASRPPNSARRLPVAIDGIQLILEASRSRSDRGRVASTPASPRRLLAIAVGGPALALDGEELTTRRRRLEIDRRRLTPRSCIDRSQTA
jgi:hypothetical protein